jgi:FtsP/CotA-like multicopper oxidase with cupredoxin domain
MPAFRLNSINRSNKQFPGGSDACPRADGGFDMNNARQLVRLVSVLGLALIAFGAEAQSFRVQCPANTAQHPNGTGVDTAGLAAGGITTPVLTASSSTIKCQQIAGGDGYATMGDGQPIYLFGFGPLSGLRDIYNAQPGTQSYGVFNTTFGANGTAGDTGTPSIMVGQPDNSTTFNGAIGLTNDVNVDPWTGGNAYVIGATVRVAPTTMNPGGIYSAATAGIAGTVPPGMGTLNPDGTYSDGSLNWAYQSSLLDGHVDPRPIMDVGVMNASAPAPLIAIDEDDELFLTLTNVGMIMRPDLFEQHTVHFHGYPNAAAFYDGVPDASIAIEIGGSFTYYYLAPDAGTYFWHCHIAPPEHLQMGMVGQLYVRPRQDRVSVGQPLYTALAQWDQATPTLSDPGTATGAAARAAAFAAYEPVRKRCGQDIMCTSPIPPSNAVAQANNASGTPSMYAYNDGDGSTRYDVEYPLQIHGFDPNFHFVGMTFNPESFFDMKDKYFTLNGRSYPDTVGGHVCGQDGSGATISDTLPACQGVAAGTLVPGPMQTQSSDGTFHASQPIPGVINIPAGGRALLRISDLDVTEYQTLASLGIPMKVVGFNARLLRDMAGNNTAYTTNSITLAGGESIDVILDASGFKAGQKFYLYTPQLDHLSNDAENFGGLMTEVNICTSVDPIKKVCTI